MIMTPSEGLRLSRGSGGGAYPTGAVWCTVPGSLIHLDLAVDTVIQDIDFAFV